LKSDGRVLGAGLKFLVETNNLAQANIVLPVSSKTVQTETVAFDFAGSSLLCLSLEQSLFPPMLLRKRF